MLAGIRTQSGIFNKLVGLPLQSAKRNEPMSHVYSKLWIHAVFATKDGTPLLNPPLDSRLHNFIHEQLLELGCPSRIINGTSDHIHMLFLQNPGRSITEIVRKIKHASSCWVNQNNLATQKFGWQKGYAAFAVSESQVQRVFDYIRNQKTHHLKESYTKEIHHLIELHGLKPLA